MRLNRTGVVAGIVYLGAGFAWLVLGAPDNPWLVGAWLVIVALAGAFIPGEANHVSLARAYLAAPAFVYALAGQYGFLAVAVAIAGLTDLVDGTVARRFAHPSNFGGGLDPAEVVIPIATVATYAHLAWALTRPAGVVDAG